MALVRRCGACEGSNVKRSYISHKERELFTPGYMFVLDYDIDALAGDPPYVSGTFMVIQRTWKAKLSGGFWEYLCLGPGATLDWHRSLGAVYTIVDPLDDTRADDGHG